MANGEWRATSASSEDAALAGLERGFPDRGRCPIPLRRPLAWTYNAAMPTKIDDLIRTIRTYNPDSDTSGIERAYQFARNHHAGQKRLSGGEYIDHPVEVARLLAELQLDNATISAGILHDVLEDTQTTYETLRADFGEDIADIVDGVTKIGRLAFQ